jgi:hypothetical protein
VLVGVGCLQPIFTSDLENSVDVDEVVGAAADDVVS